MNIGNVKLANPYILAPMAGVTDLPFRLLCKEQGAGLLCMEMISAKALQYKELALLTGEINYAYEVARSYERGKTVVADGDKASFYYAKLALSEDKHGKKKKALKNLKRFKSSDGIHWDSSTSRKMKKKAEKVKEKDPDAYVLAEETVKAAVDESLSEKSE